MVYSLGGAGQLIQQDGVRGLWRGVGPRMLSAMLWGTCMVSTYEFLKRSCVRPLEPGDEL